MHIAVPSNQTAIEYNHESLRSIRFRGYPTLLRRLRESGSSAPPSIDTASLRHTRVQVSAHPSLLGVERVAQRWRLPVEVCQHPFGVREREIEDWVCCVLQETRRRADGEKADDLT